MGRRSYSGEKWRREQARKAKREAKAEKKREGRTDGESGGGPPIDWDAMVGGPETPPAETAPETAEDEQPDRPQ